MTAEPGGTNSLIDKCLPSHDFSAAYDIRIGATPPVIYESLLNSDFSDPWLVRVLMAIRSGRWLPPHRVPSGLRARLQGTGFVIVAEDPNKEIVIGVAGRFWRPDGGRRLELTPHSFVGFSRSGQAKAAWNFKLRAASPQTTILSTETRIKCFGSALWKFRLYWSAVGPFSGLIRKAILQQIKDKAESAFSEASQGPTDTRTAATPEH